MMFADWKREIVRRSFACGGDGLSHKEKDIDGVIAAAASVIASKGPDWALSNPELFKKEVLGKVGNWATVGFFILRMFGFSNPFLLVASWLLPVVLNWIQEHASLATIGACAAMDWKELGNEADSFARGIYGK